MPLGKVKEVDELASREEETSLTEAEEKIILPEEPAKIEIQPTEVSHISITEPILVALLEIKEEKIEMKIAAISALGTIKEESSIPLLREVMKQEDWEVKREAAAALAQMGDTTVMAVLYKGLEAKETSKKIETIKVIARIGDIASAPHLKGLLKDKEWSVQREAALALAKMSCPYCEKEIFPEWLYCGECGVNIQEYKKVKQLIEAGHEFELQSEYAKAADKYKKALQLNVPKHEIMELLEKVTEKEQTIIDGIEKGKELLSQKRWKEPLALTKICLNLSR